MSLSQARKLLLLGILRQKDMHGYQLHTHLAVDAPISLKKPTAYHLLARMEEEGLIEKRTEATGERERHIYSVTNEGETVFLQLLRETLGQFNLAEFPGLVCLNWVDALPRKEAISLLKRRRRGIEEFIAHVQWVHSDPELDKQIHASLTASSKAVMEYWHKYIQAEFELIDQLLDSLGGK